MWNTPSLFWAALLVPVRIPPIGQIEPFNYLLYLKSFDCVQTNH